MNIKIPNKIMTLFNNVNSEEQLKKLLLGQAALLQKMSMSNDADVLDFAILKKSKIWKIQVGADTMFGFVEVDGVVYVNDGIYKPVFDVEVKVWKRKILKKEYLGKVKINGSFENMSFEILDKANDKIKEIELKKFASFSLLPIFIQSILRPVAIEILEGGKK